MHNNSLGENGNVFIEKYFCIFLSTTNSSITWPGCFSSADVSTVNRNGVCVSFYRISCITIDDGQITVKTLKIKVGGRECWLADFTLKIVELSSG